MDSINQLAGKHTGQDCYIVGKGKSLEFLTKDIIGEGVVIALNHAIAKVEELDLKNPIYAMAKDGLYFNNKTNHPEPHDCTLHGIRPKKATILVHKHESPNCWMDYKPRFVFDNQELGLGITHFSALSAIKIAGLMGCKKLYFVSFDACTSGDCSTYIPGRGVTSTVEPYTLHCDIMQSYIKDIDHDWITPKP